VSAKLEQLLGYLDRDGVDEIVLGLGRPVAIRTADGYQHLTSAPVAQAQLDSLFVGTPLDGILESSATDPVEVSVGRRRLRLEVVRRGAEAVLKIALAPVSRSPAAPEAELLTLAPTADAGTELDDIVDEQADVSEIAVFARAARQRGASDLHIASDRAVTVRVLGTLMPLDPAAGTLSEATVEQLLLSLLGPRRRARLAKVGYVDLALDIEKLGRLRANISRQQGGLRGAFRLALSAPATLEQLGLPQELASVVNHHQGLVVIAGPSGQGKTTTLAALVDLINTTKPFHIITVEDPVEIEHPRKAALVSQREVGRHTKSFVTALKASLREDPDVIVIGELRDRETVEIALAASETGHLVIATMSTPSAAKTIDRLIDMFPADEQSQVRASIAGALRAIVAQRLLPAKGGGVVPAIELVTGVLPLAVLIRDDKMFQLPNLMQRGRALGMIRFDESLLELRRAGKITDEVVRQFADNKKDIAALVPAATKLGGVSVFVPKDRE
jgi:twitching motility protein PilT